MKKIKLLTGLTTITCATAVVAPLSSCSIANDFVSILSVSSKTQKLNTNNQAYFNFIVKDANMNVDDLKINLSNDTIGISSKKLNGNVLTVCIFGNNVKTNITFSITFKYGNSETTISNLILEKADITKSSFIEQANEWVSGAKGFCNSSTIYDVADIDSWKVDDVAQTSCNIQYENSGEDRTCTISNDDGSQSIIVGSINFSGEELEDYLEPETTEGVKYESTEDNISYENTNDIPYPSQYDIKKITLNKYGYVEYLEYFDGSDWTTYEVVYKNAPHSPKVTGVTLNKSSITIKEGGTDSSLYASLSYETNATINWNITQTSEFITIDKDTTNPGEKIKITGKAAGQATITATCDGITSDPCTINVNDGSFEDIEWAAIVKAINEFEGSTQDETAMKSLCKTCKVKYIETGSTVEDHLANFIGLTHKLTLYETEHTVRIIGINHDAIVDDKGKLTGKKATFTFELVEVVSDRYGAKDSYMDYTAEGAGSSAHYDQSTLRYNLNGDGTKPIKSWDAPVLPELKKSNKGLDETDAIKSVQKFVGKKVSESSYVATAYSDKLFPLSIEETHRTDATTGWYATNEGTVYKYYEQFDPTLSTKPWVKTSVGFTAGLKYYLRSPHTFPSYVTNENNAWAVSVDGKITECYVWYKQDVSFAFCI